MGGYIDLLTSLPKTKRDIKTRSATKDNEVIKVAKQYGYEYFDGDRKYGYGGYHYDGRWRSVAKDIIKFFDLKINDTVLDIGCAKGFLVNDLLELCIWPYGVDVSEYAKKNSLERVRNRIDVDSAEKLRIPDKCFDLVISINTLHNLPRDGVIRALKEIERVSKGKSYIVVDSYHSEEEKKLFESWVLTAETYGYPEEWLAIFKEAGYTGFYSWNCL